MATAKKATEDKTFKAAQETVQETVKAAQKTAQDTVKVAQENVQKAVKKAQDTAEKTVKTAQKTVEKTVKSAQETAEKAVKKATSNLGDVTEFSKANYEALVASGEVVAKVAKTVNAEFLENSKKAVEKNMSDMKELFAAKTPTEFFKLQASIFKARYEEIVSESTRVSDVVAKNGTQVVEPLKARYEEVAAKYNLSQVG
ncbi:MAG: TIGR01841 family phasin [Emcibacter sp.]|nr:TIGR01841 family phasin [Emcibacter sp.]